MRPLIEVHGLRKDYRRGGDMLHAVDGIDLALMPGESVGVIGESGAGKSTLARCITRLERPTEGGVFFRGTDVTGLSDRALRPFRRTSCSPRVRTWREPAWLRVVRRHSSCYFSESCHSEERSDEEFASKTLTQKQMLRSAQRDRMPETICLPRWLCLALF